jgi:hypothetical protein
MYTLLNKFAATVSRSKIIFTLDCAKVTCIPVQEAILEECFEYKKFVGNDDLGVKPNFEKAIRAFRLPKDRKSSLSAEAIERLLSAVKLPQPNAQKFKGFDLWLHEEDQSQKPHI